MPLGQPIEVSSSNAQAPAQAGPPPQLETAEPEDPSRLVPVGLPVPEPAPAPAPVPGAGEAGPPLPPKPEPIPVPAPIDAGPASEPRRADGRVEHHHTEHRVPDPTHPSTDSHPVDPTAPKTAPTATIDPNIPSSESAPTALPTNPNTHPEQQKEAIKNEHREVVKREVEKTKAAERDLKGEQPLGTVVRGIEDDRLYAMLRRFDTVSPI